MDEISELKCSIFDLENEQKGLQMRFNQIEEMKRPLYQRLSELLMPKKTDEKLE